MAPAAEGLAAALDGVSFHALGIEVWSNVTARPHERENPKLLKKLLVEQLVNPVRWSQSCSDLVAWAKARGEVKFLELAPGSVLKGLFRRIDRSAEVTSHDQPS
jgi:malonyl CoA-acyl carrier protein transacylase